jgi:uncharacterized protein (DUF2267 family)
MSNEVATMNPFAAPAKQQTGGAVADAAIQREAQEVQAMMVIAKKFPRDQVKAMDSILQAFTRPTLAEGALYSYNRGGSDVTGPSIRCAEAIAQMWGNLSFGIRELDQRNGESTVEAFAWDLESNTRQVKVFQVPHMRHTKKGSYRLEDPRDIYEMVANQGARRLRACILGVIPGDVIEAATRQAEVTLTTTADTSPEAIKKMVDAFAGFGVTREQIEKRIQRRLESITPALMVQMKKVYQSLRDGMSAPADWFEVEANQAAEQADPAASRTQSVKDKIKGRAPKPEPAQEQPDKAVTYAKVAEAMRVAGDVDTLDARADMIRMVADEGQRTELNTIYHDLREKMEATS